MNYTFIFLGLAFLIYIIYNVYILNLFGVPSSLSMTYYLFMEKNKKLRILFPLMMFMIVGCLMPSWLKISEGSDLQFTAFLAACGIMFTGSAPYFNRSSLDNKVHSFSAMLAALFALIWVFCVSGLWYVAVTSFLIVFLFGLVTKSIKSSYIYLLETVAFISTFSSIIIYYLK